MKRRSTLFAIVLVLVQFSGSLRARPTTALEAQKVVTGWLKADPRPLGTSLGPRVIDVETFADDRGRPVYYVVYLQPSGFVIVSADDLIEPIIGFADGGNYDPSFASPLGALVTNDLNGRVASLRGTFGLQMEGEMEAVGGPRSKWRHFIGLAAESGGGFGLMGLISVGDVRVIPLLQSEWGQQNACGYYCYNYYAPRHYPCGCVATVMAQVMRYHEYPTAGIGIRNFSIYVDDVETTASTRGGDGLGGPYNYAEMVLRPDSTCSTLTEAQRAAIGALCYDAGLAVEMKYSRDGSGALMSDARDAMVNTFRYGNAVWGYKAGNNVGAGLTEMINPNLDAKIPVMLAISRSAAEPDGGHAIICDGYGYEASTLYHHLNMGWRGTDDAWYNLPDIDAPQEEFRSVFGCIYNVFPSGTGEIISGRVLDPNGRPIPNVRVEAGPSGRMPLVAITDDRGIYAFEKLASNTNYTLRPRAEGYVFSSQSVGTRRSRNNFATSGNRWGIAFYAEAVLNPPPPNVIHVDANAPGDPGPGDPAVSDPNEDGSADCPFDALQEAIDAAVAGDTVLVLRGTYSGQGNRDLDFKGKAVAIRGEDPKDPSLVMIDCDGTADDPHRGFEFHSYETPGSVLEGLTITGGYYQRGGGIYCSDGARPTVINCTFSGNSASLGGGMYIENSSPALTNCTFANNSADGGGGIYNNGEGSDCDPAMTDCTFYGNTAVNNGGAMYNWGQADPKLTNCAFTQNSVSAGGGGAIRNNESGRADLTNCMFIENSADTFGGAIRTSNSGSVTLVNCTFSANSAAAGGGSLACTPDDKNDQAPGGSEIVNCILWDGDSPIYNVDGSVVTVTYSNVQGGSGRFPWPGEGNIDADPHFADPDNGDYHLKSQAGRWDRDSQSWVQDEVASPCIDAGNPNLPQMSELWPHGRRINMGAYGGTPQASMSLSDLGNIADLNTDGAVDWTDRLLLMRKWLCRELFLPEDLDRDGIVNFNDFSIFADAWLWQE